MNNAKYLIWDLKEIIDDLIVHHPKIQSIYLFGSRAYRTNSMRSDIDILAITEGILAISDVNSWLHDKYPPVDLFLSYDEKNATSAVNGSVVFFRNNGKHNSLIEQLNAIKLWDIENGLSKEYTEWNLQTANNITFQMSIIPSYPMVNFNETLNAAMANLEASGIKSFFAGSTWQDIAYSITNIIETAMIKPTNYQRKACAYSFDLIKIQNEYDFQNLIHQVLRPIFKDISPENVMIRIDGSDKKADFGIGNNKIVIEVKWIDSTSKKAEVIKTLEGLKNFYSENANVRCLIFLILYKKTVDIDKTLLNYKFSYEKSIPQIIVRFIENVYEGEIM